MTYHDDCESCRKALAIGGRCVLHDVGPDGASDGSTLHIHYGGYNEPGREPVGSLQAQLTALQARYDALVVSHDVLAVHLAGYERRLQRPRVVPMARREDYGGAGEALGPPPQHAAAPDSAAFRDHPDFHRVCPNCGERWTQTTCDASFRPETWNCPSCGKRFDPFEERPDSDANTAGATSPGPSKAERPSARWAAVLREARGEPYKKVEPKEIRFDYVGPQMPIIEQVRDTTEAEVQSEPQDGEGGRLDPERSVGTDSGGGDAEPRSVADAFVLRLKALCNVAAGSVDGAVRAEVERFAKVVTGHGDDAMAYLFFTLRDGEEQLRRYEQRIRQGWEGIGCQISPRGGKLTSEQRLSIMLDMLCDMCRPWLEDESRNKLEDLLDMCNVSTDDGARDALRRLAEAATGNADARVEQIVDALASAGLALRQAGRAAADGKAEGPDG